MTNTAISNQMSEIRDQKSDVRSHASPTSDLRPPTSSSRRRRAVTIVEVLFAILVTAVGLLGAIAIFPVASAQAKKARQNDTVAASGREAFHMFDTMGMRRYSDRWYTFAIVGGSTQFTPDFRPRSAPTNSVCIDSRFVVRNKDNWDLANVKAQYFPYLSPLNGTNLTNPHMFRTAFFPGTLDPANVAARDQFDRFNVTVPATGEPFYGRNLLLADSLFQFADDLTFIRPGFDDVSNLGLAGITNDRSLPSFQLFPPVGTNLIGPRPADGHISWMATLVPKIDLYSGTPSDEYVLSIVVFSDRPTDLYLRTGTGGNENLLERVVNVSFPGSDGVTGGEVLLAWTPPSGQDDALATERLKVRSNDWILLGGMQGTVPRFHWYRVTHVDELEWDSTTAGAYTRYISLMGPDWNIDLTNPQATLMEGVVAVYEKTIRLDYGSTF